MNASIPRRIIQTDVLGIFLLVVLSVIVTAARHVPAAITLIQVIIMELLVMALPITKVLRENPHHSPQHDHRRQIIFELVLFAALAAALSYGNYLLFYARHGLSPDYMDPSHPLHLQATTLTCLTLFACQSLNLAFYRADAHTRVFANHLWNNLALMKAYAGSFFILLLVVYLPWTHSLVHTKPLDPLDWLSALTAGSMYCGVRYAQRHSRHYTRHVILHLHKQKGRHTVVH